MESKGERGGNMVRCWVTLLDDTHIERDLEKGAVGQVLFDKVCEHLNLLERDYFGLAVWLSPNTKVWLDFSKELHKQILGQDATFTFNVKFYPPDPSLLAEDITRYLLCLQLRSDIMTSRLSCPLDVLAELGSYTVQSELGEYDSEVHGQGYLGNIPLAPHQTPELEDAVTELHRSHKSMTPADADKVFLQKAKSLPMYGLDLHPAKDASEGDVMLGVCADGLKVYEGETQIDSFPWPRVLKMSYKRSRFLLKILQEQYASESTLIFNLPNYHACKSLWKTALEHHAFFRNYRQDRSFPSLLHLGSTFHFHGNTHTECLEASSSIKRPPLHVARSAIKRKAKESMLETLKRPNRTELDDWFQVLDVDQLQPSFGLETFAADQASLLYATIGTKTYKHAHKVTWMDAKSHAYGEREEGEGPNEEAGPQQLGGRSFPPQGSLSSNTNILKSGVPQSWKQHADDWYDLLNPRASKSSTWILETAPSSLQSSQLWEQRRELEKNEWEERTSEESAEVVKIMKEAQYMRDGSEGLEVETRLKRADIAGESLEMVIVGKQPIMKSMEEKLEEQEDGARLQNVVIHQQRTQEVQRYDGQPQEVFTGRKIRKVEIVGGKQELLVGGQVVSEETIEGLEKKLLELESIEQRVQDTEGLKVRFREGEILEEKLRQAEQERALRRQQDDWHILMHHRHLAAGAKTEVALQTGGIQQWEEKTLQRPNPLPPIHTEDNWHVLLNLPPMSPQESWLTLSPSASLQSSQLWEQRQELEKNEWEERTSEESAEVVKIMKEAQYMRDGSEGLEVETRLKRADIAGESLEMVIVGKQPIMKSTEEKLEEQEDGARLQNVVIHQQRTQEVQRYDGQPQEVFTGRKIRKVEIVGGKQELLVGGQVVSEETIEGLEKKLLELESIEQRVQDTEGLKVRFREGEILEEKLRQAEQERAQRRQQDDWHILMHHRHLAAGAKTEVALQTGGIQQWEEKTLQRPNPLPPIHTEDNWHVLLNLPPRSPQESWLTLSPSASLQSSQLWEQRRELEKNEWEERTSEESAEVVKIMKEAQYMRDGSEGLEVETRLKRADIAGESLEMVIVGKQPIMKSTEEKLEEQEDGARLQNVVIHQQRTQEVQRYDGQPQDVFTGRKIRKVEIVGGKQELLVGGQVVSEETIEGLEKKLLELESIEQRVQDTEGLKVRFREGEILEEKLRQAEQERALRRQQDDWHILMHHRHLAAGAKTEVALQTGGIQQWEEKTLQRPNPLPPIHTEDNWHVLLNLPPRSPQESWLTLSPSASLQSSQLWEQRRELEKNEWEERTSEESAEVVKIMKEAQYMRDGSEGLEVETRLKRADIAGESLEMVIVGKQPIMKSTEEKLEEQEDGARLQNVVIHQQRTQEVQRYDGQPQDVFTGRKIRKVEIVGGKQELLVGGQVVSEETIEGLEKKLLELESIEQRVQDTEGLKVRFREGEILEEKLRQAEQERALRRQQDDWHILMHHRHLAAGAKTEVALQTGGIQQWEEKTLQRPNPLPPIHTEDNWHVLLNLPPRSPQESWLTLSPSASLQSSQLWEQRRELEKNEWEERTSEESAEVVKIMKEAQYMRDGSEGLEVETRLKRADIAGESLEMVIVGKQPIMKSTEEKLEEQEDGARLQNVVIHQQRTQEVQRYDGQPQEVFTGRKIRKVEIVGGKQELLVGGQVVSEETIEGLEKKLLELESIEERLQDIEGLKVRLLEVEILEEKLRQAEQERALRRQQDDWHILLYHRPLAAGAKTEVALQTGGIQQWEEKTLQRPNPLPPIHTEDNSHVLLNLPPRSPQESWLTLSLSDEEDRPVVPMVTESRQQEEERRWQDERKDSQVKEVLQVKESSQPPIAGQRASQLQREVNDDWFVQLNPSPKQSVPVAGVYEDTIDMRTPQIDTRVSEPVRMKGREVMIDVKPMIIEEKHLIIGEKHTIIRENPLKVGEVEKIPGALQEVDDSWFVLFDWTPFERRSVGTEVSDTWLSEERRTKEVQERKIREEERRKQEARALLQGEASNKWFVLLETPKGVKELDRRATEERVMEEELKKRVTEEERRKRAAVDERRAVQLPWEEKDDWFILLSVSPREPALKPPPVPVMSPVPVAVPKTHPLPPADQPLTSTPTARPAPITRPTYQEERTKMQDITQESIQDITQEETESSVLIRERKAKRIEGETIFIRHSILMLENFDETPEVVLRHHASIRELKRLFLEDVPVFGPTEWDKRLSTHTPVKIPKVTNGDLFLGMDLMADEILVT